MVLCKFFMQGTCKMGTSCKFDHQINPGQTAPGAKNTPADLNTLVRAVQADMTNCEKGGQWILSSYAPFKEKPEFPGFEDKSFEEIRLQYYESAKNGTAEIYKQQLQVILQEAMMKIRALQNPSPDIINILKQIYNTKVNSSSNFGGNTANPGFGGTPSVFSQVAANLGSFSNQQSIFNKPALGGQNNSIFGGSTFNSQPQGSIFSNNTTNSQFGPPNNASPFNSQPAGNFNSPLGGFNNQQMAQVPSTNVFSMPTTSAFVQSGSLFNTQPQSTSVFNTQPQSTSVFNTQAQNTSVFNTQAQSTSIFNTQPQNSSVFNVQPQSNSMFQNQPQGASIFNSQPQSNSIFSNQGQQSSVFNTQKQAPVFNTQTQASSAFNTQTNVFNSGMQQQPAQASPFSMQQNVSPFISVQNQNPLLTNNSSLYSKEEDLTQEEINAFKSDLFTFGMIPEKPPSLQLCQ